MNYEHDFYTTSGGQTTLNCGGKLVDFTDPHIMGILNVTPDSFYDGGKFTTESQILNKVETMMAEGATFIDIGAQSSRPGAKLIDAETEASRLLPAINSIFRNFPDILISVDTFHSSVANSALDSGAVIINDISAGEIDPSMYNVIKKWNVPYIIMHMKGKPADMQNDPKYIEVVNEVFTYMRDKIILLKKLGIHDVIIDPGFGFGKTVKQNYSLLKNLEQFSQLGKIIMAGLSRKSMICKPLKIDPKDALIGTSALHMSALMNGARMLRVHDVKEAIEVIRLYKEMQDS